LPDELRVAGAVLVSGVAVWALTPLAIRLAVRTSFYDYPKGYKAHPAPTAYLGGAAVMAGFLLAAAIFGDGLSRFAALLAGALALLVIGTLDDRVAVRPTYRVLTAALAGVGISLAGLGWSFLDSRFEEAVLTAVWVVAFSNAFNLMDNLDGAASTVGGVCAAGIALVALAEGDVELAAFTAALAGACLGFLRYNLRRGAPARIFLGDGGSMPLGFLVAAAAMNVPDESGLGWPLLLVGGLLLGIPTLDTLLVIVSRTRRGVALVTAGRDHLTHRLQTRLGSARRVAVALALVQGATSVLALAALQAGRSAILAAALMCLALGGAVIALLERPAWVTAHSGEPTHNGTHAQGREQPERVLAARE
jgi:UDP-GlcNAc:undecaprenyl-phosphate GlcNAc-1-phosphate transferase